MSRQLRGDLLLRHLARSNAQTSELRSFLGGFCTPPLRLEQEVVVESCLYRISAYRHALQEAWLQASNKSGLGNAPGAKEAILDFLAGIDPLTRSGIRLVGTRPAMSLRAAKAFLTSWLVVLNLDVADGDLREEIAGWLIAEDREDKNRIRARFLQRRGFTLAGERAQVDLETSFDTILECASSLFEGRDASGMEDWLSREFAAASLIAPIAEWVARSICLRHGLHGRRLTALARTWASHGGKPFDPKNHTDLLIDLASGPDHLSYAQGTEMLRELCQSRIDPDRLFDPSRLDRERTLDLLDRCERDRSQPS
ncbi:MAG TPA: hypothetical protein PKO15_04565 [Fibrobacteria bacterium]|nr:hypothetical protein [Fibrobacteria bacterium]HOX50012.1 hypothetical protein [Fibrobacteria bacterium]